MPATTIDLDLAGEPINPTDAGAADLRKFIKSESPWDRIAFNGQQFSGLASVDVESGQRTSKRPTRGRNGARIVDAGRELAEVTLTLVAWLDDHYRDLFRITTQVLRPIDKFNTRTGQRIVSDADAVFVDHPALRFHGIEQIYAYKFSGPNPLSGLQGAVECKIKCHEFVPLPKRKNVGARVPVQTSSVSMVVGNELANTGRNAPPDHAAANRTPPPPSRSNTGP